MLIQFEVTDNLLLYASDTLTYGGHLVDTCVPHKLALHSTHYFKQPGYKLFALEQDVNLIKINHNKEPIQKVAIVHVLYTIFAKDPTEGYITAGKYKVVDIC